MKTIWAPANVPEKYLTPDLLKEKYRVKKGVPKTYGHCYVACEAMWHLGLKHLLYKPFRARDDEGNVHWWFYSETFDKIIDPTASQYTERGLEPPYERGRAGGFLTKEPSFRAKLLMIRIVGL